MSPISPRVRSEPLGPRASPPLGGYRPDIASAHRPRDSAGAQPHSGGGFLADRDTRWTQRMKLRIEAPTVATGQWELLPFRFHRLDTDSVVLTNMVGEHVFVTPAQLEAV